MKRKHPPFLRVVATEGQQPKSEGQPAPVVTEETREELEAKSPAIRAAVRYVAAMAAMHEGFKADHTDDGMVAGFNEGGAAATQLRVARRQLKKLISSCRLSRDASPVEMAAKASVAKFLMVNWRSKIWEVDSKDPEGLFLDAFAGQVEEMCTRLYSEELDRDQ